MERTHANNGVYYTYMSVYCTSVYCTSVYYTSVYYTSVYYTSVLTLINHRLTYHAV